MTIQKVSIVGTFWNPKDPFNIFSPLLVDLNKDGFLDFVFNPTTIPASVTDANFLPLKLFSSAGTANLSDNSHIKFADFSSAFTNRIIASDLNHDGRIDLVLGASPETGNASRVDTSNKFNWGSQQYILLQNENGSFTSKMIVTSIYQAHYIEVSDFNNDGFQDIIMISDVNQNNKQAPIILLNDGAANFTPIPQSNIIGNDPNFQSFYGAVGDFNNDGNRDIVFLNGGAYGGIYNFVDFGDGKGGFTKGPNLPIIPKTNGGGKATVEGSLTIDLNSDGQQDLIIWVIDRSDANAPADTVPGHLEVLINTGNGNFVDQTANWLGNFATTNVGGDTRSLVGYLANTKLISLNIALQENGPTPDGYIHEQMFLYNDGTKLIPIFDPFWNSQNLPVGSSYKVAGSTIPGDPWGLENGSNYIYYEDYSGNLVRAVLNPSDELQFVAPHDPFIVINRTTGEVSVNDGYSFSISAYRPWNGSPSFMTTMTRELRMNTPGDRIFVGTYSNDYISAGNAYAGSGKNIFIGNGGTDCLMGGIGDDIFLPTSSGQAYVDGRDGIDTVVLRGARSQYTIQSRTDGSIEVIGNGVDDIFRNVEMLRFSDLTLDLGTSKASSNLTLDGLTLLTGAVSKADKVSSLQVGDTGHEKLLFSGKLDQYTVTSTNGVFSIADSVANRDSSVLATTIGGIQFSDRSINTTMNVEAGKLPTATINSLVELYVAYFARTPDATGLSYWIDKAAAGETLTAISKEFYTAGVQFSSLTGYSASMANTDFIKLVYTNVLGRSGATAPPDADVAYWDNQIKIGATTKEGLIQTMLGAAHGFANDPTWGWVPKLLDNKISVGYQAAVTYGLDYNSSADAITQGMAIAHAVTPTDTTAAIGLIGVAGHVFL